MGKVVEWHESGKWSPTATGELDALAYLLKRWIRGYPLAELEAPLKVYFANY